jgi:hypothetical protein
LHGTTDKARTTRRKSLPRRESKEEAPDKAGSPDMEDIAEKGVEAKNSPDKEKITTVIHEAAVY